MIVVSNSSPLIILAKLSYFDVLFSRVCISSEVHREIISSGSQLPGAADVSRATWIETTQTQRRTELLALHDRHGLGLGELSTILLARELSASIVLLDDQEARKLAKQHGLQVRGTLGVLETAYRQGHISDLREAFSRLLQHSYISRGLLNDRLSALGLREL